MRPSLLQSTRGAFHGKNSLRPVASRLGLSSKQLCGSNRMRDTVVALLGLTLVQKGYIAEPTLRSENLVHSNQTVTAEIVESPALVNNKEVERTETRWPGVC